MRRLLLTLAAVAAPSLATAQTTQPPPPNGASGGVQGSVTLGASAPAGGAQMAPMQVQAQCSPAADSLYNEGMNRMAAGDDTSAANLFARVLELCPTHPTAAEMRRNAEQHAAARGAAQGTVQTGPQTVTVQGATPMQTTMQPNGVMSVSTANGMEVYAPVPNYNMVYGPDPITLGARLNLVIGQTINGIALGAFVPAMIAGPNLRPEHVGGGMLLGGALGAAGSLVATLNGVTQGQAIAVNMGSGVGLGLGASIALLSGSADAQVLFGLLSAGDAVGTAVGAVIALQRPLSGKMSYVSSLAGWGTFLTSHVYFGTGALRTAANGQAMGGVLLGGLAGGTAAGALTASLVNVSADRMGWIDLSMGVGWLVVGLSATLFAASGPSADIAYGWGSIGGVALGAVFGVLITRNTDAYWHAAHDQQAQQGAQRRARANWGPSSVHFSPGGPGGNPLGFSLAGAF